MRFWPFRLPRPLAGRREVDAYLGLGANLGERLETLKSAIRILHDERGVSVVGLSSVYETEPVTPDELDVRPDRGSQEEHPPYLNAVVRVVTSLRAQELLAVSLRIEAEHGRDRAQEGRFGPRPLDIDLLLYGDEVIDEHDLQVPHPRLTERAFVLVPLAEVMPPGSTLPDGSRVTAHIAANAPVTGIEYHVRLSDVPGAEADPLLGRPSGPAAGPPQLSERHGGPGRSGETRGLERDADRGSATGPNDPPR